ncbi:glutathionylspermidine synthase family protein [Paenibacillus sp. y28]
MEHKSYAGPAQERADSAWTEPVPARRAPCRLDYPAERERLYGPIREEGTFTWDVMYEEEYALAGVYYIDPALRQELAHATERLSRVMNRTVQVILQGGDDLLRELGIPEAALAAVRVSLSDAHPTIIGRFDFAQTTAGLKMLEFNSDTPTGIVEAYYVNGRVCEAYGCPDPNAGMAEHFRTAFEEAISLYRSRGLAVDSIVFSALDWHEEDAGTTRYLLQASGLHGIFAGLGDLRVYGDRLCLPDRDGAHHPIDVLYRLHALEKLSEERDEIDGYPTGAHVLDLMARGRLAAINPPSALVSQTKALQALIWSLHEQGQFYTEEEHRDIQAYMLPTYMDNRFQGRMPYVSKPIFGREGGAVTLHDADGTVEEQDGEQLYWEQPMIFQKRVDLPQIEVETLQGPLQGHLLWGSFCIAGRASAVVARVGGRITGNMAYYLPVGLGAMVMEKGE